MLPLSIPGIGSGNASALVVAYHRGSFAGSDAFISYLGLDVRIRESGYFRGKRKLTKRGEPELRRFCSVHHTQHVTISALLSTTKGNWTKACVRSPLV